METRHDDLRFAVLIDADNISPVYIKEMLQEVAKYGTPTFKRIYGDWTSPRLSGWKNVLLENAINPVQQYSYTTGKNASDSALIIDAMDILYTKRVDGFCIVSSDSDFTRLATRLREAGMKVFGIGEKKTPSAFVSACDKFIYLEILAEESDEDHSKDSKQKSTSKRGSRTKKSLNRPDKKIENLIKRSIDDYSDDTGWVFLGELGNLLIKKKPDFDPRNYGFPKLLSLIKSFDSIEIDERDTGKRNVKHVFVRNK